MIEPSGAGEVTGGGAAGDLEGLFDEAGGEAGEGKLLHAGDELGGGGTQRLTRAVGKFNAMRVCLTGDMFTAAQMQAMGVVCEVVPDNETISRALAMAQQIAELPPLAVQQIKEIILAGEDGSLEEGLRLEAKAIQLMFSSQDQKEGMAAFIEKRKAKFQGK